MLCTLLAIRIITLPSHVRPYSTAWFLIQKVPFVAKSVKCDENHAAEPMENAAITDRV
jgi:hypothetical protein